MWTSISKFPLILLWLLPGFAFGQECTIQLSGVVTDAATNKPLADALVVIEENNQSTFTNESGTFLLQKICAGEIHLHVSHIGCAPQKWYLKLEKDTVLHLKMQHHTELIGEVEVHGEREQSTAKSSSTLKSEAVIALAEKNLAQTLDELAGVSTISNGAIGKPMIQGMWGNRVDIVNNGVAQAGQQWGIDHAPEIDAFTADHISVVKGASALEYSGTSLGGVVLVEPVEITRDPHWHGVANYIFQTNGLGHTLNFSSEKRHKWGGLRFTATGKLIGDRSTPNYYLTNTGNRELNLSLGYQKNFGQRLSFNFYTSSYATTIGILRGSHISNTTDLDIALTRDEPFFTNDYFSYNIAAPQQKVQHYLAKAETKYLIDESQFLHLKYGFQRDVRNEFDVRRAGRSENPSLSLTLISQSAQALYENQLGKNFVLKSGFIYEFEDNSNDNANTGRLPLIPDYRQNVMSAFAIGKFENLNWLFELGARSDIKDLFVLNISQTLPREVQRISRNFSNISFSAGGQKKWNNQWKTGIDVGLVQRQPEVNELYSSGLHQGLASLEYGNPNLLAENSLKIVLNQSASFGKSVFLEASLFAHQIENYIFLAPTGNYELTISGSFPVFEYQQTDAFLLGADILASYYLNDHWKVSGTFSWLRGHDQTLQKPLVYMPPTNFLAKLQHTFADGNTFKNTSIYLSGKYVAKQWRLDADQDFIAAPNAYFLLGASAETTWKKFTFALRGENLLNTTYRDYLNRLRYFADDFGLNISLRLTYNF